LARQDFKRGLRALIENRTALAGVLLIALFALMAVLQPILMATVWPRHIYHPLTGYDPDVTHPSLSSAQHLLGTDTLGRDVFSMLLAATTPAFVLGLTAALTTAIIGTLIGAFSAYYRGMLDTILSHLSDVLLLIPAPIAMVAIGARFSQDIGPFQLGLIYGLIAGGSSSAIVMRAHALTVMNKPFIDAARVAGGAGRHIIFRHLLPHMLPLAVLQMMLAVTASVVADGFLSFTGLTRTYLNWGTMIYLSRTLESVFPGIQWHILIPPSIALSLFALGFYLVARGIQQIGDPQRSARHTN
jgi:peptide/nickel transport system permease protein